MKPESTLDQARTAAERERKSDPFHATEIGAPMFSVRTSREGDSAVVKVSGELDLAGAPELDRAIRDAEYTEIGRIVIDLTDLTFIDSGGLNVLLGAKSRDLETHDRLRFTPSKHDAVSRFLSLTGATDILS